MLLDLHFKLRYEDVVTSERLIYGDFLVPGACKCVCVCVCVCVCMCVCVSASV